MEKNKRNCVYCKKLISETNWSSHIKTYRHLKAIQIYEKKITEKRQAFEQKLPRKLERSESLPNISKIKNQPKFPSNIDLSHAKDTYDFIDHNNEFFKIQSGRKGRFASYRLILENDNSRDWLQYFTMNEHKIYNLLMNQLKKGPLSYQMFTNVGFYRNKDYGTQDIKHYISCFRHQILNEDDINDSISENITHTDNSIQKFLQNGSGWIYQKIIWLQLDISKYEPLRGNCYKPLPKWIMDKQQIINVQNTDNQCFKWSILSALHPAKKDPQRLTKYTQYENELNFDGIEFPVQTSSIKKFENQNNLAIFLYLLTENKEKPKSITTKAPESENEESENEEESSSPIHLKNIVPSSKPPKIEDSRTGSIVPLRRSKMLLPREKRIHLLLYKGHYMWIKNLSGLLYDQNNAKRKKYFCDYCLQSFNSEINRNDHETRCQLFKIPQKVIMPKEDKAFMEFKNYKYKLKTPFVIYGDFETFNGPCEGSEVEITDDRKTKNLAHHKPFSFSYIIIRSDGSIFKRRLYRGPDTAKEFMKCLKIDEQEILNALKNIIPMKLTEEDHKKFDSATMCHICQKDFTDGDIRVRDHDHITGEFRGAAHQSCNLNYRFNPKIPIFFHNLSGFDSHIIMQALENKDEVSVTANNMEKYKAIYVGKHLVFKDSLQYFAPPASLDNLTSSLLNTSITELMTALNLPSNEKSVNQLIESLNISKDELEKSLKKGKLPESSNGPNLQNINETLKSLRRNKFSILSQYFPDDEQFELMTRKGFCPYKYLDKWDRFEETTPPHKEEFYNELTADHISDQDYQHFINVWKTFNIQNLGEYVDLYLKLDVLLLADIFENNRQSMLTSHGLDPSHYLTAPHFSFDALFLKCTLENQKPIELLIDIDMHIFFEQGIRGGISVSSKRHAKANPKYYYKNGCRHKNPEFDPLKPPSYIIYLDANNLYGWAMMQYLPIGGFRWLTDQEIEKFTIEKILNLTPEGDNHPTIPDSKIGYAFEVDLIYPENKRREHSDYPMAPENIEITPEMLSPYQLELSKLLGDPIPLKSWKLAPNVMDKEKYICHYRLLKFYLQQGLQLKKIYRIIEFEQAPWMKNYIEMNTALRQKAISKFMQDLFKLLNNAVFGKTVENVRKRRSIKFPSTDKQFKKWTSDPRFQGQRVFTGGKKTIENAQILEEGELIALEMHKSSVILNKPIFTGFSILELSKLLMYEFWYEYIKPKYGEKAQLCYTDTDSFIIHIETEDVYEEMHNDGDKFDFSDYSKDHPFYSVENKKVVGKMKDEEHGELISEFCGIRSKLYSILKSNQQEIKKAKGVSDKQITSKILNHQMYKDCIFEKKKFNHKMKMIRSKDHQIYLQEVDKITLNPLDTKRWICADGITTLPFGHPDYNVIEP